MVKRITQQNQKAGEFEQSGVQKLNQCIKEVFLNCILSTSPGPEGQQNHTAFIEETKNKQNIKRKKPQLHYESKQVSRRTQGKGSQLKNW